MKYFGYQNSSFLVKDLHKANQAKNEEMVNWFNEKLIDLWNAAIKNKFFKMKTQIK